MRAAKVQASLRIRAVSPEPPLLAHTGSESRGTFRQKTRSLAPLNGWACAVNICHDGMLEDTNSLDGAHLIFVMTVSPGNKPKTSRVKIPYGWAHMFSFNSSLNKNSPAPIAQLVECPLRGTGGQGFDPGPRHTKVVKNGTSCSSLGTQTYGVELGLVDPVSG